MLLSRVKLFYISLAVFSLEAMEWLALVSLEMA